MGCRTDTWKKPMQAPLLSICSSTTLHQRQQINAALAFAGQGVLWVLCTLILVAVQPMRAPQLACLPLQAALMKRPSACCCGPRVYALPPGS